MQESEEAEYEEEHGGQHKPEYAQTKLGPGKSLSEHFDYVFAAEAVDDES